ncbi:MAG TPA: pyrroline-5-carboxylate reductase [Caulobacterales bacterium]|nr:pyrroline-5-carboxylate reductase [Caulobacterales bacterium]
MDAPAVALLGAGQMGGALIRGWIKAIRRGGGLTLTVREPNFDPVLEAELAAAGAELNPPEPGPADVVVIAVKPQIFKTAAADAKPFIGPNTLVLSIMAGVTIGALTDILGTQRIIRAMPNTPGQIGQGITAYVAGAGATAADKELAALLLEPLGVVEPIPNERLMDVVTAVSGSGPAYVFLLAEVLAAAAENEGLDRETARRLAGRTVAGAGALMLETGADAATLRKQVTSPGGTTEAALDVLQTPDGLALLLRRAVQAATHRSRELGKELDGAGARRAGSVREET